MTEVDLEKRVADLEERVSWLEAELRISQEINVMAKIRMRWNLTPSQATLLDLMYRRRGRYTSREFLVDLMSTGSDDPPERKIIDVHVCRIRSKLKNKAAIITEPFVGYRISDQLAEEIGRMQHQ